MRIALPSPDPATSLSEAARQLGLPPADIPLDGRGNYSRRLCIKPSTVCSRDTRSFRFSICRSRARPDRACADGSRIDSGNGTTPAIRSADLWLGKRFAPSEAGSTMSFRKKLLLLFAATVLALRSGDFGIGLQHHPPLVRAGGPGPRQCGRRSVSIRVPAPRLGGSAQSRVGGRQRSRAAHRSRHESRRQRRRRIRRRSTHVGESAATRLSRTSRRSRHHPFLRPVAGEVRISRSRDSASGISMLRTLRALRTRATRYRRERF